MKEELQRIIGENLYRFRNEQRLTREEIAEKAGISVTFYANLEAGNRMMSIETLHRIAAILNVSTDSLLYQHCPDESLKNILAILRNQPKEVISLITKIAWICVQEFPEKSANAEDEEAAGIDGCKV